MNSMVNSPSTTTLPERAIHPRRWPSSGTNEKNMPCGEGRGTSGVFSHEETGVNAGFGEIMKIGEEGASTEKGTVTGRYGKTARSQTRRTLETKSRIPTLSSIELLPVTSGSKGVGERWKRKITRHRFKGGSTSKKKHPTSEHPEQVHPRLKYFRKASKKDGGLPGEKSEKKDL